MQLNIYQNSYTNLNDNFIEVLMGASNHSEYIPIICSNSGEKITKGNLSFYLYKFFIPPPRGVATTGRFTFATETFFGRGNYWYQIKTATIRDKIYYFSKGLVCYLRPDSTVEILMCIGIKSKELFNIPPPVYGRFNTIENLPTNFDSYRLVINNSLLLEEHLPLYRNLNRSIISEVQKKMDVIYTNNINSLCFKTPDLTLPKFQTMGELKEHLREVNDFLVANAQTLKL